MVRINQEDTPGIELALLRAIEEAEAAERTLAVSENTTVVRRFREVSGRKVATASSVGEIVS